MTTIDQVRDFWDARPCNVRHSSQSIGTRAYFDEVESKKLTAEPHISAFCEFNRWRGLRVLEIGCGIGTMAKLFAEHGADYTGVELSGESLALARQRFKVYGLPGSFYHCDAEHLMETVSVEPYDLVFTWGVIHHSPNPSRILEQVRHYMRSGTILKVMVYAATSWKNCMIEAGLDQPEAQWGCPIAYTYSERELIDMVGPGFWNMTVTQDHIFPYQIEPYKQGLYVKQPWFDSMPQSMFRALERRLGWHLMLTAERQ